MRDRAILKARVRGANTRQTTMVSLVNKAYPLNYLLGKTDLPQEVRKDPRRRGRTAGADVRGHRCLAWTRLPGFPSLIPSHQPRYITVSGKEEPFMLNS